MKLFKKLPIGIINAILIFSIVAVFSVIIVISSLSVFRLVDNNLLERHTYEVMISIDAVISDLQNAETGQRGYVLTGRAEYLEPYTTASQVLSSDLQNLQDLINDNPAQQERLSRMRPLIDEKIADLQISVVLRNVGGFNEALKGVLTEKGKQIMDSIRLIVTEMKGEESNLLQIRLADTDKTITTLKDVLLFGGMAGLLFYLLVNYIIGHFIIEGLIKKPIFQREKQLLESVGDGVVAIDRSFKITLFNKAATILTGWSAEEAIGKPFRSIIQFVDANTKKEKVVFIEEAMLYGEIRSMENHTVLIQKDGREMPVGDSASPVFDASHQVDGCIIVFRDMSREYEKANELAVIAKEKETMFASIGDGLLTTDVQGNITFINKTAEKLLGYKNEEVMGKVYSEIVLAEDEKGAAVPSDIRPINLALAAGATTTTTTTTVLTYNYLRKDKTKFPVAVTVTPVILDGKIIGTVEVFRDITKEKEIDRAKSEFVSLASHQLRTPLTSIKWHTELLSEKIKNLGQSEKTHFTELTSATTRMSDIINSFLNVTRLELGTVKIQTEKFNLMEVAEQFFTEFTPVAKEAKVELVKKIIYTNEILQDKTIINNVLQNLLSNAIKYTPAGGQVILEILADPKEDKNVLIKVTDTGYGIPEAEKDKIFNKMFRAENVKKKIPDGNGLGLYIVKSLVNLIKGRIWFESQENKGTTFFVTFPKK